MPMTIRKYEADSLREAMRQAQAELGQDAMILNTREIRPAAGVSRVELVAAVGDSGSVLASPVPPPSRSGPPHTDAAGPSAASLDVLASEVAALRRAIEAMAGEEVLAALSPPRTSAERRLRDAGVEPALAGQIALSLASGATLDQMVAQWKCLFSCAPLPSPDIGQAVFAICGPPGSGKTSLVAKLTSELLTSRGREVGVISCDSGRIWGPEQLQVVTRALQVPFRTCFDAEGLSQALDEMTDCRTVFVDTPGGAACDAGYLAELKTLLSDARVHPCLALPANLAADARAEALKAFAAAGIERVIVTRVDDTPGLASLLAIAQVSPVAISHISHGPRISGDLRQARPEEMARLALEGFFSVPGTEGDLP